ncbi:multiple ankyrin repeats single kh domain protein [Rutstroemia sp. NJR-2017a BBW]|nr:multiple ankyrin repeats single kh domain protein [Rutstroemia sp. NJR-2017a BBW]
MNILDLPMEIFHEVLLAAVISRGVKRALRLKLVCKQFYDCLQPALFESRLLDEFGCQGPPLELRFTQLWYIRKSHGAEKLWQSYLVYRVQNETDPEVGRFVEIRNLAEELSRRTETQYETTVNSLCWLALETGSHYPGHRERWRTSTHPTDVASNPGLYLLSAAAYFNYIPLARQLLSDGNCPTSVNNLFPSPLQLAAWAGNADMLRLFQEHLPEFEEIPSPDGFDWGLWRGKVGPGSIKGASLSGDLNIIRLAVYPESRSTPDNTDFSDQPFGKVDIDSQTGSDLYSCLYQAKNWEIFQYIDAFFKESIFQPDHPYLLARYAQLGNLEILRKLLDAGSDINGGKQPNSNPLVIASRYCHEDIVDLLLERGADPNYCEMEQRGPPLCAAAAGGSITIVRKLLAYGANDWDINPSALRTAVRLEHTAMVNLFLELDIGDAECQTTALGDALSYGMESMVQLLKEKCPHLS